MVSITTVSKVTTMLTNAACQNADSKGKQIRKLPDGAGLYLWVYADGRKYWRLRYWVAGKEKSLSLGVYPAISLKEARAKRDAERKKLDQKLDPSAERRAEKLKKELASDSAFEVIAREWYDKQLHTWVPHHAKDVLRRLEVNIFPKLGRRPIAEIDGLELLSTVRKIEERGSYDLAHRVLQVCGQIFRYGIATGRCGRNVAADLRGALKPHITKNQSSVTPEALPELMQAIADYETIGDKQTRLALQLLAITFVRTNELIGALWSEFDMEKALWVIPAERMKMRAAHVVPLSKQALTLLKEIKPIAGNSQFVFPGRTPGKPISNNTMLFALYRLGYKGRMTGHGFRSVASTVLNENAFRPDVIERQLAHCERDEVRGAYNKAEYLTERKAMMQWWGDHLESATIK